MKPDFRKVLEIALNEGISYGYNKAYKHVENPHQDAVVDCIIESAMNSLYEWFEFDEDVSA